MSKICSLLCTRIGLFVLVFGLCIFFGSMGTTYMVTAVQSLQKQYHISSRTSGVLMSAHEIGYVPSVVILSYLGSKGNRAKWIGFGTLLIALGNLLISMPNFLFPSPELNRTLLKTPNNSSRDASLPVSYCEPSVNKLRQMLEEDKCSHSNSNDAAVGLIAFALIMVGVGHSMPWSLGVPLVDDNVKKASMPVCFGLIFGIKFLGPMLGFFLGAFCNSFYNNLERPIGLTPADPRWISAWWLGFLAIAVALFGPAMAMFCFPANPPVQAENEEQKVPQLVLVDRHLSKEERGSFGQQAKQFGQVLVKVTHSPVAMGTIIGRTIDAFTFKGFLGFMPKYLEDHYGLDPLESSTVMGFAGLIMMISGLTIGSVVMKRLKLEGRRAATWVAVASLLTVLISMSPLFLGCHSVVSYVGKSGSKTNYTFETSCNAECMCSDARLHPVCSRDGEAFYSPCHAGCQVMQLVEGDTGQLNFTNCSCVAGGQVSRDWCDHDCGLMVVLYMGFTMCAGFVSALAITPSTMLFLRSVDAEHRSLALGLNAFTISLGTLASPILFGAVIDSACLLWENACGSRGFCNIYDPYKLRIRINSVVMVGKIVALSMDLWVWYFAKGLRIVTGEEEENGNKTSRRQDNVGMGEVPT